VRKNEKNKLYSIVYARPAAVNADPIEKNLKDIITEQKIESGNTAIFDDISILGIEFTGL